MDTTIHKEGEKLYLWGDHVATVIRDITNDMTILAVENSLELHGKWALSPRLTVQLLHLNQKDQFTM